MAATALLLLLAAVPQETSSSLPSSVERRLAALGEDLARAGFAGEGRQCLLLLRDLAARRDLGDLEEAIAAASGRRPVHGRVRRLVAECGKVAALLAREAERARGEASRDLARAALAVDGEAETAHRLLGHERGGDGVWRDAEETARVARRAEILEALARLRAMDFPLDEVAPGDPTLLAIAPGASAVEYAGLRVEAPLPGEDLAAVARRALRALALSNWLLGGTLEPAVHPGFVVFLPERSQYEAFLEEAVSAGRIEGEDARRWRESHGATLEARYDGRSLHPGLVTWSTPRRLPAELLLLFDASLPVWQPMREDPPVPPWFVAGHVHLVGLWAAGAGLASWQRPVSGRVSKGRPGTGHRLLRAGWTGGTAWLRERVLEGRDPPFSACQLEWFGAYQDESLLKVASVVEMLHVEGEAAAFVRSYAARSRGGDLSPPRRAEAALGRTLPELDAAWREWILGRGQRSVAGRLREFLEREPSGTAAVFLDLLNEERRDAGLELVAWSPELARGAAAHARYVAGLSEADRSGPASREEDPAVAGWSLAGAEAAPRCMVGEGTAAQCLADWLRTVQARTALLHPGLLAVGGAFLDDLCVVDATSLVEIGGFDLAVWPPAGARDVPRRKFREWPEPAPQRADPETLGLPVTLVVGAALWGEPVRMRLFLRHRDGSEEEVECFRLEPWSARQADRSPEGLYALIPERPLEADSEYRLRAQVGVRRIERVFRTSSH